MRVLVGVMTSDGKRALEATPLSPGKALLRINMFVIIAGTRPLFVDADTGNELTFWDVVKASLKGGDKNA